MYVRMFFSLQLIVASCADNTDLIRDYFVFKKINRVAGFSCGDPDNDVKTAKILNDAGITVSLRRFGTNVDLRRFLWTQYGNLGVFLDLRCSDESDDVSSIYDEVNETNLTSYTNESSIISSIQDIAKIMDHLLAMKYTNIATITASAQYLFEHLHHWLILEDHRKNLTDTARLLNESTFSIITDFVISIPNADGYALYDVYNHCKHCGGSLIVTELGIWTNNTGLSVNLLENMFTRRWNYHQVKAKVAGVVLFRPKDRDLITYLQEPNVTQTDIWSKFGFALILHTAEMFNFTLDVIELDFWPKNAKNGPLMSGLKERKYDIGYYPSILTIERLTFADVTLQVFPTRTCFMFRTIPSVKNKLTVVFRPFQASVWYTVFALSIVIILTLWLIWKLDKNCDSGDSTLILVAALCQQGLPFQSDQFAGRIAFLQTMIFGLLLYNCYSAAMVSSRLNIPLNKMNDSLYPLVKSKLKLSARKDLFFKLLLSSSSPEVRFFKKHWDDIPEEQKFQELLDGVKTIMHPGNAYHAIPTDAYPIIERLFTKQMICQLTEVHLLQPSVIGLWTTPHSQFKEITKIGLIRMVTAGIRKRQVHRWISRKPFCEEDKRYVSSVTILETAPIIVFLLIGIALSTIICVIENIVFRMSKRKSIKMTTLKRSKTQNKAGIADKKKPKTKIFTTSIKK